MTFLRHVTLSFVRVAVAIVYFNSKINIINSIYVWQNQVSF